MKKNIAIRKACDYSRLQIALPSKKNKLPNSDVTSDDATSGPPPPPHAGPAGAPSAGAPRAGPAGATLSEQHVDHDYVQPSGTVRSTIKPHLTMVRPTPRRVTLERTTSIRSAPTGVTPYKNRTIKRTPLSREDSESVSRLVLCESSPVSSP